ncbi:Protein of unknown function, partial [Gryllus bimaculatus]
MWGGCHGRCRQTLRLDPEPEPAVAAPSRLPSPSAAASAAAPPLLPEARDARGCGP